MLGLGTLNVTVTPAATTKPGLSPAPGPAGCLSLDSGPTIPHLATVCFGAWPSDSASQDETSVSQGIGVYPDPNVFSDSDGRRVDR